MIQLIIDILFTASLYLIISNSFIIIYYPTKFFHIAHAIIICIGAYFTYTFSQILNLPIWLSVALSIISSILIGLSINHLFYNPLRKQRLQPLFFLIASIGVYIVLQNCISIIWGDDLKSLRQGKILVGHQLFNAKISSIQIFTIVISIFLFILSIFFFKYSKIGRNIRAFASNDELAKIFGINPNKLIRWAFALGSGVASIAGILIAFDTGFTPTMGFNYLFYGIVVMIIGGVGSNWGIIGGAFILSITQHLTSFYFGDKWMDSITYLIMILFLVFRPLGISGKRLKKIEI